MEVGTDDDAGRVEVAGKIQGSVHFVTARTEWSAFPQGGRRRRKMRLLRSGLKVEVGMVLAATGAGADCTN